MFFYLPFKDKALEQALLSCFELIRGLACYSIFLGSAFLFTFEQHVILLRMDQLDSQIIWNQHIVLFTWGVVVLFTFENCLFSSFWLGLDSCSGLGIFFFHES